MLPSSTASFSILLFTPELLRERLLSLFSREKVTFLGVKGALSVAWEPLGLGGEWLGGLDLSLSF